MRAHHAVVAVLLDDVGAAATTGDVDGAMPYLPAMAGSQGEKNGWQPGRRAAAFSWLLSVSKELILLVLAVLAFFGISQLPIFQPDDAHSSAAPTSGSPSPSGSASSHGCLAYQGGSTLQWQETYDSADFALVDCSAPHEFEVIDRDADTPCDSAVYDQVELGNGFASRALPREIGPTGCAVGRYLSGVGVETQTFRIATSTTPIKTFGTCIAAEDVDSWLTQITATGGGGISDVEYVGCQRGEALTTGVMITDEDPETYCRGVFERLPAISFRSTGFSTGVGDRGVSCTFLLTGWA